MQSGGDQVPHRRHPAVERIGSASSRAGAAGRRPTRVAPPGRDLGLEDHAVLTTQRCGNALSASRAGPWYDRRSLAARSARSSRFVARARSPPQARMQHRSGAADPIWRRSGLPPCPSGSSQRSSANSRSRIGLESPTLSSIAGNPRARARATADLIEQDLLPAETAPLVFRGRHRSRARAPFPSRPPDRGLREALTGASARRGPLHLMDRCCQLAAPDAGPRYRHRGPETSSRQSPP